MKLGIFSRASQCQAIRPQLRAVVGTVGRDGHPPHGFDLFLALLRTGLLQQRLVAVVFKGLTALCLFGCGPVESRPRVGNDQIPFARVVRIDVHRFTCTKNHSMESMWREVKPHRGFRRIDALACEHLDFWVLSCQIRGHHGAVDHAEALQAPVWHGKVEDEGRCLGIECLSGRSLGEVRLEVLHIQCPRFKFRDLDGGGFASRDLDFRPKHRLRLAKWRKGEGGQCHNRHGQRKLVQHVNRVLV